MTRVLASVGMALLVAVRLAVGQDVTIDWARTAVAGGVARAGAGPDGETALELHASGSGPTSLHLAAIEQPAVAAPGYVITGQVRYQDVEGLGYLEMWSVFPNGERFFTRTLAPEGTLAALRGASGWRRFELPFSLSGTSQVPSRLELNLALPGRGSVWLGPLRLERYAPTAAKAPGTLFGIVLGSLVGLMGATIGVLTGRGKARRLVLALLWGMFVLGACLLVFGTAALWMSQPRDVWYPALLIGALSAGLGRVMLGPVKSRYAADELRRMQAMDAGRVR